MIQVNNIHFGYTPDNEVLSGLSVDIIPGEILSIVGPNGSGKTTLMKLLRGTLEPTTGTVMLNGRATSVLPRNEMARLIAVVPQRLPITFAFSVYEVVAMGRFAHHGLFKRRCKEDTQAIVWALEETDTSHLSSRPILSLSGGELQRVLVARALAQKTPILLLDEASSHLDIHHRIDMLHLLHRLNKRCNTTIIQVSHDVDLAAELSHRMLLLGSTGTAIALGAPQQVITSTFIKTAFNIDARVELNPQTGTPRILPTITLHTDYEST